MMMPASYANGFAPRDGQPLYPELWRGCKVAIEPSLGPTGGVIRDWSGVDDKGVLTDVTAANLWTLSQGRYAAKFAGGNERVLLSKASAVISGATFYSVACWFNATSLANSPIFISNVAGSGTGLFNDFFVELASSGTIAYWGNGNSLPFRTYTTSSYTTAAWNHLAVVKTGTGNNGKLFLNGREQTSFTGSLSTPRTFQGDLALGWYNTTAFSFNGLLDGVRFYNRMLSEAEVKLLATRRGIASELALRRRSSIQVPGFRAAWIPRQRLIIGGGV